MNISKRDYVFEWLDIMFKAVNLDNQNKIKDETRLNYTLKYVNKKDLDKISITDGNGFEIMEIAIT